MAQPDTTIRREMKMLGIELTMLGNLALIEVRAQNEEALGRIIDRRNEILTRVQHVAITHDEAVRSCVELADAARQEAEVLALAQPRCEELLQAWQSVQQRLALRQAYQNDDNI